jgi:hypothetical protein
MFIFFNHQLLSITTAQISEPLTQPGLSVHPEYVATSPKSFFVKRRNAMADRATFLIFYLAPAGGAGDSFLEIIEEQRNTIIFRTTQGQEVMRIVRVTHRWSSKPIEYHGMRGAGNEVWCLNLMRGLGGSDCRMPCRDLTPCPDKSGMLTSIRAQDYRSSHNHEYHSYT